MAPKQYQHLHIVDIIGSIITLNTGTLMLFKISANIACFLFHLLCMKRIIVNIHMEHYFHTNYTWSQTYLRQETPYSFINETVLVTKQVIYKHRQITRRYSLEEVKAILYHQMKMGEYMARTNKTEIQFDKTWDRVAQELSTLGR